MSRGRRGCSAPRGVWVFARIAAGALATWIVSGPAQARAQVRVALVELDLEDEAPPETLGEVQEALAAGLRRGVASLVTLEELHRSIAADGGSCAGEGCLERAASTLGAQALLRGRFSQVGQLYEVGLRLQRVDDGSPLGAVTLTCEVCTLAEALDTARRAGEGLAPSLPGLLALTVSPASARLTVDGHPVDGASPLVLSAGDHELRATAEGHRDLVREVPIISGARSSLELTLTPLEGTSPRAAQLAAAPERPRSVSPYALWGWISAAAAAAALVPGVIWLALEGECAIDSAYQEGICVDLYYTWPQGLVLTLVGAGLLAAAIPLLVLSRRGQRQEAGQARRPLPTLALTTDGASLGLSGRF